MKADEELGDAQLQVLKTLWELEQGTVAAVQKAHQARGRDALAYTTVMTMLNRLVAKGLVRVDKEREPFVYRPARRPGAVLRDKLKRFVDVVFDGKAEDLVLHLLEDEALSPEDLARIQQKLKKRGGK